MEGHQQRRTVSIKTLDGILLEGWFWSTAEKAPAIIMTHGLNCVKEMSLSETAEAFHAAGYNVLLYDSRSIGGSGSLPRNQIDPWQNCEDLLDVVSYTATQPSVNPRQILLWGLSLGGTISGCSAALDPRVAGVIMVCPIFTFIAADKRQSLFTHLAKDRASQLRGTEPLTLPPFNKHGSNPAGYAGSGGPGGKEAYTLMRTAAERGHANFRDRITLQSFGKLALFRPRGLLVEMLDRTPVMMVVAEEDCISLPGDQMAVFERLVGEGKRVFVARGAGHMDVLAGQGFRGVLEAMLGFCDEVCRKGSNSSFVEDKDGC
ncbi:alpha/beta-hydrolase [Aspergillus carlsbadensis]|nr:alpha/beta-hydrolase [Aspergillus carlsbadensis]